MNATQTARLKAMIGQKTTVACRECGAATVVRQNKKDLSIFLGCNDFPACKNTQEITEEIYMALIRAPRLPGL